MHKERPSFNCCPQISMTSDAAFDQKREGEKKAKVELNNNANEFGNGVANEFGSAFTGAVASTLAINGQMISPGAEGGPAASGRRPARQRGAVGGSGFRTAVCCLQVACAESKSLSVARISSAMYSELVPIRFARISVGGWNRFPTRVRE